jgi:hypothetical protein
MNEVANVKTDRAAILSDETHPLAGIVELQVCQHFTHSMCHWHGERSYNVLWKIAAQLHHTFSCSYLRTSF